MSFFRFPTGPISGVTRRLIVVVFGCAVLETAQPMIAAEGGNDAPVRSEDMIIYPQGSTDAPAGGRSGRDEGGGSVRWLAGALLLAAGGGWLLLKRRGAPLRRLAAGRRLIDIEETRSVGGRQYLVVARCEGRRFLLGVTTGRIQLLSPLDDAEDAVAGEGEGRLPDASS